MSFNFSISALRASGMTTYAVQSQLSQLGIPDDIIEQGDTAIANYAYQNHITLPTAQQDEEPLFDFNKDKQTDTPQ